jgi:hypothetical protein
MSSGVTAETTAKVRSRTKKAVEAILVSLRVSENNCVE